VVFPRQRTDISYGRDPHDTNQWRYLVVPTPGGPNLAAFTGEVGDLRVSHGRGFYDAPFLLELSTDTAGATIVYTVDGGVPCDAFGVRSAGARVYTGPISVSTTTCVRAAGCRSGWLSTPVQTHTYVFVGDVVRQSQAAAVAAGYPPSWGAYAADYEMDPEVAADPQYSGLMAESLRSVPTVSIVTDKKGLFDASTGIYTNPLAEGDSLDPLKWERPVSMELFQADGAKEVQIDCGLRIQGGHSRHPNKCPKHSFGLRFRGAYGQTSLDYELFDGWPVRTFDSLQLRSGFNNVWTHWDAGQRQRAQYVRDHWARDTLTAMGNPDALQGFSVHLYLNGMYWGLYMLHERPSASHYAAYHGGDPEAVDAVNGDPTYVISDPLNTGQVSDGTIDAWLELKTIVAGRNWDQIQQVLDVDNFIDWTILNYYGGNIDLKRGTNWRAAGGGPLRRPWRFYSWDAERILEDLEYTSLGVADATGLFNALYDIEEFRVRFGDRVHRHLFNNGCLTPDRAIQTWTRRSDQVEQAVIAESARWGDYRRDVHRYQSGPYDLYTKGGHWIPERDRLLNQHFPARTSVVVDLFRNFKPMPLYPGLGAPVFQVNGSYRHGGQVASTDTFSMAMPAGTTGRIYYTLDGTDPRVPSTGDPSGLTAITLVPAGASKRVLVPTAAISEAWRSGGAFDDSAWALVTGSPGGVGFDANPASGGDYTAYMSYDIGPAMNGKNTTCYIRIPFTVSGSDIGSLAALTLKVQYDDGFVAYLNGTEVCRAGLTGTPVWNSKASAARAAGTAMNSFDISGYTGSLRAGQNLLAIQGLNNSLTSTDLLILAELSAGKTSGGPEVGVSCSAVEYKGPIRLARSAVVKARVRSSGEWSALNEAVYAVGPVAESLRVTEIMYHPQDTGDPADPNAEYIELANVGSEAINLNLVRFTEGIGFTFGDMSLQPGRYVLVVKDLDVFTARYGEGLPVAGVYEGSLSNGGEGIRLEDALGRVILDFEYKDGWYKSTDGRGHSLVVREPGSVDPGLLGDKDSWLASPGIGGSPGQGD